MQSRTSYFNKAIFLNTLKRFWPLWLAYFALWVIVLPVTQSVNYLGESYHVQREILDISQQVGTVVSLGYGALAAMAVWSFMYNSKTMSGVACLPIKREGVFLSVSLAGILPAIVANIVVFGLTMLIHVGRGYASVVAYDAMGLAIVTMTLIFFYGFATLCAQLTGNLVTLPAVYLVLNFTAWVVETIVNYILDLILFGVEFRGVSVSNYLSPILGMFNGGPRTHETYMAAYDEYVVDYISYEGFPFLIVCCVVGIVMLGGALLLYRRRRMESVGDVVAVQVMKPVFKYCMTFGCALVSGIGFYALVVQPIVSTPLYQTIGILCFMLFGAIIGYFAAEMLIHKSFRVFKGRWKGLIVSFCVICVAVLGLEFDLLGIEKKVPDTEDIDYVYVYASDGVAYREPENIEAIAELHKAVIENKAVHENSYGAGSSFDVSYYMKDGSYFNRTYWLRYDSIGMQGAGFEDVETLEKIQNSPEAIAFRKSLPFVPSEENILGGSYRGFVTNEEMMTLNPELTEEEIIIINYYGYDEYYVLHEMSESEKMEIMDEYRMYGDTKYNYGQHVWDLSSDELWELYTECIIPDLAEGKLGKLWIIEDDDYFNTVCSGRLAIEFWYYPEETTDERPRAAEYNYEAPRPTIAENLEGKATHTFSTTPTVGSRTYEWLADHGIILHTVGEELALYDGYESYGKHY